MNLKVKLVQSLVFPHFDYCDIVYGNGLSAELSTRLQRAQNSCIRFIYGLRRRDHVSVFYNELRWFKLDNRRKLHQALFLYKLFSNNSPSYLVSEFSRLSNRHYNTRRDDLLAIPIHRTEIYHSSFLVSCTILWNSIPPAIRIAPTLFSFRRLYLEHLLSMPM